MEKFELTILGSNSAMPAYGRWPTSQVLELNGRCILLDCGEGAQIRMSQYKVKKNKIDYVLISHLHGDHIYGLMGFLGSLSHLSRKKPLTIFGPKGIREYVETNKRLSQSYFPFELIIEELAEGQQNVIVEDNSKVISCFPVNHRITTFGYLITEKGTHRNINKDKLVEYSLRVDEILKLKEGHDLKRPDGIIPNSELTLTYNKPRSYAYCADSRVEGWSQDSLKGVDLLYFETTYLHDLVNLAHERGHATALEAAQLARELEVGQLIIGHYSSRYREVSVLLEEAKAVFPRTLQGYDGLIVNI